MKNHILMTMMAGATMMSAACKSGPSDTTDGAGTESTGTTGQEPQPTTGQEPQPTTGQEPQPTTGTTGEPDTGSTMEDQPTTTGEPSNCGNGVLEPPEECDVGTHSSISCTKLGYYGGGNSSCNIGTCLFDLSQCHDFSCQDGGNEISGKNVCDEQQDCEDGSDEFGCECGDGVKAPFEACDEGQNNSDEYNVNKTCNATCSGFAAHCGDGVEEGPEECDFGNCSTYSDRCDLNLGTCKANPQYTCENDRDCGAALDACDLNKGTCIVNSDVKCNTDVPPPPMNEPRCTLSCNNANPAD